jgi:alpha-beta hydrolase superfamily lysophospholipase
MKEEHFIYRPEPEISIFVRKWLPDTITPEKIKGIIQIVHGMTEHGGRYASTAEFFTQHGFIVYADDHRGYYKTAGSVEQLGKWKQGWWRKIVNDLHELTLIVKKEYPNKPIFLLGHSMGSFLAQDYSQEFGSDISGLIMSGTNGKKSMLAIGQMIANKFIKKYGEDAEGIEMKKITMKNINEMFQPIKTEFDWLSRDERVCKEFEESEWTGFVPSYRFFSEMLSGLKKIWKPFNEKKIPKTLPVYIFAGTKDPVGNYTKGIIPLIMRYRKYGIKVDYTFYENGRHEMLNEINRDEVRKDLLNWINKNISN